jgi:hypothetical protein
MAQAVAHRDQLRDPAVQLTGLSHQRVAINVGAAFAPSIAPMACNESPAARPSSSSANVSNTSAAYTRRRAWHPTGAIRPICS